MDCLPSLIFSLGLPRPSPTFCFSLLARWAPSPSLGALYLSAGSLSVPTACLALFSLGVLLRLVIAPPIAGTRQERAYARAVDLVLSKGYSQQAAVGEIKTGTNATTLFRRVRARRDRASKAAVCLPCTMSAEQEKAISELCSRFASRGASVGKQEIAWIVQESFGSELKAMFKEGNPGKKWIANFLKRSKLSFSKPSKQAAERFSALMLMFLPPTWHLSGTY